MLVRSVPAVWSGLSWSRGRVYFTQYNAGKVPASFDLFAMPLYNKFPVSSILITGLSVAG